MAETFSHQAPGKGHGDPVQGNSPCRNHTTDLREEEKLLGDVQRLANIGSWIWNIATSNVEWSGEVYRIFGLTPAEFNPTIDSVMERIHPEDRNLHHQLRRHVLKDRPPYSFEARIIHSDGNTRNLIVIAEGQFNEQGKLTQIFGIIQDITERKQSEETLLLSKKQLEMALLGTGLATWHWNIETGSVVFSEQWAEMLGYTLDELTPDASTWERLVHPTDLPKVQAALRNHFRGQTLKFDAEHRLRHKSGDWIWMLTNGRVIKRDANGRALRACGIHADIDKRKRAEASLKKESIRRHILIEQSRDGIVVLDHNGKVYEANRSFADMLGYTMEECGRLHVWDWDADLNREQILGMVRRVDESGHHFETRHRRKDGTFIDMEISSNGAIWGDEKLVFCVCRDITERKLAETERQRLEAQVRQTQKLESIGGLAGGIAHDFNNILSSILGFTELALDDVEKGTILEENLQEVYVAANRASDLVKQILAFARQSTDERKPIALDASIREVLKLLRSTLPASIEIRPDIHSNSLIMGNATQIHQVFMNLCTNAADAMNQEGGVLTIGLEDVLIDKDGGPFDLGLNPGDYLKATVTDTGTGIAPDTVDNIFEPYFTTKGTGSGTGMGLAVVHGIIESYGGKIYVESTLGKGTVFTIYLPISKKRGEALAIGSATLPTGTERILFVDDEAPIAMIGNRVLGRLGYSVTVRTSSIEALELFRAKPDSFDLVITDMTMPNMTGDLLAEELLTLRPDIPVILCTGYSRKISDENAMAVGIKAFIYKPVGKKDLAETVRRVLDSSL